MAPEQDQVQPINLRYSAALFGSAALLLALTIRFVLPALSGTKQAEPVLLWFAAAGIGVFVPLVLCGWVILYREKPSMGSAGWMERLHLRPMAREDWIWAFGGLSAAGILTAGLVVVLRELGYDAGLHPSFMAMEPLTPGRFWILAVWLPFFLVNILGEEFLWRGVVLPRQEIALGSRAWLVNGIGWLLFHLSFPWQVLVTLIPTTLILPYVVQRRGNTWIGVVIHAALNGPAFLALAFGVIS